LQDPSSGLALSLMALGSSDHHLAVEVRLKERRDIDFCFLRHMSDCVQGNPSSEWVSDASHVPREDPEIKYIVCLLFLTLWVFVYFLAHLSRLPFWNRDAVARFP